MFEIDIAPKQADKLTLAAACIQQEAYKTLPLIGFMLNAFQQFHCLILGERSYRPGDLILSGCWPGGTVHGIDLDPFFMIGERKETAENGPDPQNAVINSATK